MYKDLDLAYSCQDRGVGTVLAGRTVVSRILLSFEVGTRLTPSFWGALAGVYRLRERVMINLVGRPTE